jgi:hypothetical protein
MVLTSPCRFDGLLAPGPGGYPDLGTEDEEGRMKERTLGTGGLQVSAAQFEQLR